ncbi:MAG: transcriptional regulator PpsR [Rubrimonas sp.]|uniref:transcriptional regulator PpsR n=1 Tax=Rubrimonas sp. TaxID=2036015 RepID=UPI002FDD03A4
MQRPVAIDPISPFRTPETTFGLFGGPAAAMAVVAACDVALVLDPEGVIVDLAHNGVELSREGLSDWVGRPWRTLVGPDSVAKVDEMLAGAAGGPALTRRQINMITPNGAELPVSFATTPLAEGRLLALGREMRSLAALQSRLVEAQHGVEREYARLRDAEMRYRLLFQMTPEPLMIVDAATRRIAEANPAAERILAPQGKRLVGRVFPVGVDSADLLELERLVARARATGRAEGVSARMPDGSQAEISAALFRQDASAFLLVRVGAGARGGAQADHEARAAAAILGAAPEGYVATDAGGVIRHANLAFLNLAQLATEEQALGESLERFLGRPGVDLAVLMSTLRESGSVRLFSTSLRGDFGSMVEVEICAARAAGAGEDAGEGPGDLFGFLIRNVDRRGAARPEIAMPRSFDQLTELVGRVPLKDLVRETTDVIERLCIEAALELTGDNRASAAEMLGLSRQSLYVKLRRYGLGDLDQGEG